MQPDRSEWPDRGRQHAQGAALLRHDRCTKAGILSTAGTAEEGVRGTEE
jgi:hypothetical protein